jgi:general secretion pathway protein M
VRPLSSAVSRALALAILVGVVLAIFTGVVQPLLSAYGDARASAAQLRGAIEHAQASRRNPAELEAEVTQMRARQQSTVGFLHGTNESLAAAEMQDRLKSVVEAVHGELRSTQILPARDDGKFRRISIRGQIVADTAGLQRVFYQLESASPLLFLDNVEIRPRPTRDMRSPGGESGIEIRFDLYGFMRGAS